MGNIFMHLNGFSFIFVRAQTLHIVIILLRPKMPGKYSAWKGTSKYKRKKLAALCASKKLNGTGLYTTQFSTYFPLPLFFMDEKIEPLSPDFWLVRKGVHPRMKTLNLQAHPLPLLSPPALT
jgi:hypothetical protein